MNTSTPTIVPLNQLEAASARHFGGKAANLGELLSASVMVPPGIALGKGVFAYFLIENGIDLRSLDRIHNLGMTFLESAIAEAQEWQSKIVRTIQKAPFPAAIVDELFDVLGDISGRRFAVRSSCTVEDSSSTSFAGQYVTILDVEGRDRILDAVRSCWASQYDGRVLAYAIARRGVPVLTPSMAVVIQEMLQPDFAGVCFTEGPTPKTRDLAIVESVPGLGEALVSGAATPYHFEIDRAGRVLRSTAPRSGSPLRPSEGQIVEIVAKSRQIADHFASPQDIEWAIVDGKLYILQARPITVVGGNRTKATVGLSETTLQTERGTHADPLMLLRDDLHEWLITQVDPLVFRGACHLLSAQKPDGAWRIEGHPEWDPVTTAMMVRLLVDGGVPATFRWVVRDERGQSVELGIPPAMSWLVRQVNPNSTWGSDLWDTCQVIRALLRCGVKRDDPVITGALDFVTNEATRGLDTSKQQEWFGAGFLAAMIQLFAELSSDTTMDSCVSMLLESQAPDGEFCGPSARESGASQIPSEWHTSQAVTALAPHAHRHGAIPESIRRACEWLVHRQNLNGSWGATEKPYSAYNNFFTSYAAMALTDANYSSPDPLVRARKWLRGQQMASGGFGDVGSSLMTMALFQRADGALFSIHLPIPMFLKIQDVLGEKSISKDVANA